MSESDILQGGAVLETATDRKARGHLPERCYACAAPVKGPYCYACGQKNDDCRRSIVSLIGESARDIASFEGRFLRTVRATVTRPGKHLRDYGRGVRSPYSPPIRFFLVISFMFFTTLWLTDRQVVAFQPEVEIGEDGKVEIKEWAGGFFVKARDIHYSPEERAAMISAVESDTAGDDVKAAVLKEEAQTEIADVKAEAADEIADLRLEGGAKASDDIAKIQAGADAEIAEIRAELINDLADVSPGEAARATGELVRDELSAAGVPIPSRHGKPAMVQDAEAPVDEAVADERGTSVNLNGRDIDADRLRDGLFRLAENPRLFNNAFSEWIPRIMILMIPLMALLGAVFVRGKDALLYDHALLSLNTHAVAFGLMTLGIWTAGFLPGALFGWAVFLGVPFYYYRAMRGAFGRRRRKVIFATLSVFAVYGLVFFTALTAAAVTSFAETL